MVCWQGKLHWKIEVLCVFVSFSLVCDEGTGSSVKILLSKSLRIGYSNTPTPQKWKFSWMDFGFWGLKKPPPQLELLMEDLGTLVLSLPRIPPPHLNWNFSWRTWGLWFWAYQKYLPVQACGYRLVELLIQNTLNIGQKFSWLQKAINSILVFYWQGKTCDINYCREFQKTMLPVSIVKPIGSSRTCLRLNNRKSQILISSLRRPIGYCFQNDFDQESIPIECVRPACWPGERFLYAPHFMHPLSLNNPLHGTVPLMVAPFMASPPADRQTPLKTLPSRNFVCGR